MNRVVWDTELPGEGNSSPIVVGDRVFVTVEPTHVICLDRASGKTNHDETKGEDLGKWG